MLTSEGGFHDGKVLRFTLFRIPPLREHQAHILGVVEQYYGSSKELNNSYLEFAD